MGAIEKSIKRHQKKLKTKKILKRERECRGVAVWDGRRQRTFRLRRTISQPDGPLTLTTQRAMTADCGPLCRFRSRLAGLLAGLFLV